MKFYYDLVAKFRYLIFLSLLWSTNIQAMDKTGVRWSTDEDQKLLLAIEKYRVPNGTIQWHLAAKKISGRTWNSCRNRYQKYLRPEIKKHSCAERKLKRSHSDVKKRKRAFLDKQSDRKKGKKVSNESRRRTKMKSVEHSSCDDSSESSESEEQELTSKKRRQDNSKQDDSEMDGNEVQAWPYNSKYIDYDLNDDKSRMGTLISSPIQ